MMMMNSSESQTTPLIPHTSTFSDDKGTVVMAEENQRRDIEQHPKQQEKQQESASLSTSGWVCLLDSSKISLAACFVGLSILAIFALWNMHQSNTFIDVPHGDTLDKSELPHGPLNLHNAVMEKIQNDPDLTE